uniref:GNAT family N-acetyltransferase n=1 Tax=Bacillus sp. DX2.2 TaxID=3073452 RepID=UPI00402A6B36
MNITISNEITNIDWKQMKEIYHSVGWKKHDEEKIEKIFTVSNVIAIAYYQDQIVGFGRAISDGVFNAAIYDVVIHNDFHKQGIGKMIMDSLLYHLQNISCVHLVATTGNETFYRKSGFKHVKTAMARYLNPALAEEYLD